MLTKHRPFPRAGRLFCFASLMLASVCLWAAHAQEATNKTEQADPARPSSGEAEPAPPPAYLIPVSLPLTGTADIQIRQMVDQVLSAAPQGSQRAVLILEFRSRQGQAGEASQFERALSLARYLASDRLSRVRTVAYLPETVKGHAVLVAAACEEIVMSPEAELGQAGIAESFIDATMLQGYSEIAARRRTLPVPVVLGMLDRELAVYRVQTLEGVRYVLEDELETLQTEGAVSSVDTMVQQGDLGLFSGRELRLKYGFVSHLAGNRAELAGALQLPRSAIQEDPSLAGSWQAIRIDVNGPVNSKSINWIIRSLEQRVRSSSVNFICVWIGSPGGSPSDSLRLANVLAEMDSAQIRTVAYVEDEARADAALIALACDQLVMSEGAILGGPGAQQIDERLLADLRVSIEALAKAKQRHWSLPLAMVNPQLAIYRYQHQRTGRSAYFSPDEVAQLVDAAQWERREAVPVAKGLAAEQAERLQLTRAVVSNFEEFKQLYHIQDELMSVEPNWAHLLIEKLASPRLAGALLFIAWFTLMVEFMSPGIGVAGFISGLCFLLFFWANFLHGTAGWLEVLLFAGGISCLALEIFVLPGFGVFGVGGGLMVISSLVLASQTFVIPRNSYQLDQLPSSLFTVVVGASGMFVALAIMRRFLPNAPVFNRLMLAPPEEDEATQLARRESLVNYDHLLNKRGITTTRLAPAGKARFGDDVINVLSEGDLILPGQNVYVVEVCGSRVLVRAIES